MSSIRPALVTVCLSVIVALATLAHAPPVRASEQAGDTTERVVEVLAQEAKELVQASLYEEAISRYMQAYQLQPAGPLLYNVAFIYDKKLGNGELAQEFYRRFLRSHDPDVGLVRRTLSRLRDLQGDVGPDGRTTSESQGTGKSEGWNGGVITMGVGGLVLAGGLGVGLLSLKTTREFNATNDPLLQADLEVRGGREAMTANIM
ncbi:MAG: hypothetical protein VX938_12640, partial [Myxococcota bacterium]|nr:hypothetical protein [Myxococcota bacterium]